MISVIIPLYNKETSIRRSVESVLTQSFQNTELIIVDDGSTDSSAEIVRNINDSRIRLIEQENGGPSKARNTGIKHARGDWFVFLHADDVLVPNAVSLFHKLSLEHQDVDIFDCNTVIVKILHADYGRRLCFVLNNRRKL